MTEKKFIPRADHVGSLLRPASITQARKQFFEDHSISAIDLKKIEDDAIPQVIKMQEDIGLHVATDGEARRSFWHYDFMGGLDGLDLEERDEGVQFAVTTLPPVFSPWPIGSSWFLNAS